MAEVLATLSAPPMFWIMMAVVGLIFGGFTTVAADRLGRAATVMDTLSDILADWQARLWAERRKQPPPKPVKAYHPPDTALRQQLLSQAPEEGIWAPASHCDQCHRNLTLLEKIPLVGWLVTGGHCPACGYRVPLLLPLAEALTALIIGLLAWRLGATGVFWPAAVLTWFLVTLALADLLHRRLPDALVFPLLWIGLLASALGLWPLAPQQAILGAGVGFGALMALSWVMERLAGRFMIGGGDVALIGALGAWIGWERLILAIGLAAILALGQAAVRWVIGVKDWRETPFGPALAAAGFLLALSVLGLWNAAGVPVAPPPPWPVQ